MAGLPLKSGADFYNLEAARLRLHNLGADPTEVGAGLIYFNTSTGLNTSQKARLYTGSAWKTIAFSEDLDVASNADFLALKDRVDLLSGDVDTDAIISNMKEVSAFLEGFAEDASLMDYLNTELGKKLDKSGGQITGDLYIQTDKIDGLSVYRTNAKYAMVHFYNNVDNKRVDVGYLGVIGNEQPVYLTGSGQERPLLHSGNVGEYNAGSADVIAKTYANESINYANNESKIRLISGTASNSADLGFPRQYTSGISVISNYVGWQMVSFGSNINPNPYYRAVTDKGIWDFWKQLAFLDDNVASAQALTHSNGTVGAEANQWGGIDTSNTLRFLARDGESQAGYIGRASSTSDDVYLLSNNALRFFVGANATQAMLINSSGNVTIGASDLASSDYKLFVYGNSVFADTSRKGDINTTKISSSAIVEITAIAKGNDGLYIGQLANSTAWLQSAYGGTDANASSQHTYPLSLQPLGGNVLIGTTTDNRSGAKLQVSGDLHVTGNIIADGEVSAGGAGTEGGGSSSGGGGAFHSESIAVGATQTTIAHGLGTDDIVVSIYEKDGVSGRWSIILTDVEIVDANNIIVSFGSATSVEHKVVIMGAVA